MVMLLLSCLDVLCGFVPAVVFRCFVWLCCCCGVLCGFGVVVVVVVFCCCCCV